MKLPFQLSSHCENPCQGFISLWRSPQRMDFEQHIYILLNVQSKKEIEQKQSQNQIAYWSFDALYSMYSVILMLMPRGTSPVMELKELYQSEWYWSQESSVLE